MLLLLAAAQEVLSGGAYLDRLERRVGEARASVRAAVFEVSAWEGRDADNGVARLFTALAAAAERGVTVEVVFDRLSEEGEGDAAARLRARYFGGLSEKAAGRVRVRRYGVEGRTLHAKAVIIDGRRTLLGSHNWTQRAFGTTREPANVEMSMESDSAELARALGEALAQEGVFVP